jgi:WD40 repeat protein
LFFDHADYWLICMTAYSSGLRFAVVLVDVACALRLHAAGGESRFVAAYFSPAVITLFPLGPGKETDVTLPAVPATANLISFAPDGRSAYLQEPSAAVLNHPDALIKVEFSPVRQGAVPGSRGLGDIYSLTVSPRSGRIFVSASGGRDHQYGAYEIDPDAGTHRPLRVGDRPNCGGGIGTISPDGRQVLSGDGDHLNVLNLETGAMQTLGAAHGSWSPDGRWIAVSGGGRIVLIDANDLSHRKNLGASGVDDHLIWSPDSKRLLFVKQENRCRFLFLFQVDDSESIEVVDVETDTRQAIPSAHCAVTSSRVGWVDAEAVR